MDLTLVSLVGLNAMLGADHDIKRKTMYSILTDFGVFNE